MLAQLGIDRQDPDYAALYLGNQILGGGGFGTRLMDQVREKRGLTYGIYSGFTAMQARGPFMINFQTRAELSERGAEAGPGHRPRLPGQRPDPEGTGRRQARTGRQLPAVHREQRRHRRPARRHRFLRPAAGLPGSFLKQVEGLSVEQVRTAMAKHLDADAFVIVSAGPSVPQKPCRHPPPSRPSNPAAFRSIDEQTYCRPGRHGGQGTAADHRWRMAQPAFRLSRRARPATDPGPGPRDPVQLAGTLCRRRTGARSLRRQRRCSSRRCRAAPAKGWPWIPTEKRWRPCATTSTRSSAAPPNWSSAMPCATWETRLRAPSTWCSSTRRSIQNLLQDACRLLETRGWLNPDAWIYTEARASPRPSACPELAAAPGKKAGNVHYALWQRGA